MREKAEEEDNEQGRDDGTRDAMRLKPGMFFSYYFFNSTVYYLQNNDDTDTIDLFSR